MLNEHTLFSIFISLVSKNVFFSSNRFLFSKKFQTFQLTKAYSSHEHHSQQHMTSDMNFSVIGYLRSLSRCEHASRPMKTSQLVPCGNHVNITYKEAAAGPENNMCALNYIIFVQKSSKLSLVGATLPGHIYISIYLKKIRNTIL